MFRCYVTLSKVRSAGLQQCISCDLAAYGLSACKSDAAAYTHTPDQG
jgi:hypothetical protein